MTIETIQSRIAGKEKAIAQLTKKLERIRKAEASNWENNPYYYSERDIRCTQKELDEAEAALANYKSMLAAEEEKANSRNVEALVKFLDNWETATIEFMKDQRQRYLIAREEYRAIMKERDNIEYGRDFRDLPKEEREAFRKESKRIRNAFESAWNHVTQFNHGSRTWDENLVRDIRIEKERKYDDIIERTNKIVGQITDASGLYIGDKQDLNGYILGTRGRAEVRTIGAGGHSIQRFHFRTLVLPA